jgi:hypothetical protein
MKKKYFGSNRNKPKQDLFRVFFGLFRETKKRNFWFVSVFRTHIETTETNRTVSKRTETIRNFLKNTQICSLSKFSWKDKNFLLKKIKTRRKNLPKHSFSYRVAAIFRCFDWNNRNKQLFRNEPKQSGIFWKLPKYAFYQKLAEQKKFSL